MRVLRRAIALRHQVSVEIRELEKHVDEVGDWGYSRESSLLYLHLERHLVHAYGEAGVWSQGEAAHRVAELTAEIEEFATTDGQLEQGIVASKDDLREKAEVRRLPAPDSKEHSR